MTFSNERSFERWEELAEAVVFAHDPAIARAQAGREAEDFEQAAALATAAMVVAAPEVAEPVPEQLFARLSAAGLQHCAELAGRPSADSPALRPERPRPRILPTPPAPASTDEGNRKAGPSGLLMFFVGIAATVLVWFGVRATGGLGTTPAHQVNVELRAELLRLDTTRSLDWSRGPSTLSGQVEGDVVWNDDRQEGFLTFRGLPPLDTEHRFQLWIVDKNRPDSAPVDGGLFDIQNAQTTETIRIDPKLAIGRAAAFVITVEDKAGAVVSKQEHVVATAGL
ncbi:MAG: anti-sigma factor [bacterium]|nr:anti-sigma factor [bacterium]